MTETTTDLDEFTRASIEAALFTSNDESDNDGGDPMTLRYSAAEFSG